MAVKILYVDIRGDKRIMEAFDVPWHDSMTAEEAVKMALGDKTGSQVIDDLKRDNPEIIVSWHDEKIEKSSEVGGVGRLDWNLLDKDTLTIVYENRDTTNQMIDLSSDWMMQQYNNLGDGDD